MSTHSDFNGTNILRRNIFFIQWTSSSLFPKTWRALFFLLARSQGAPLSLTVTLRGKKYEVTDATSVADVQKSVEDQAGLAKEQQVQEYDTIHYNAI